MYGCRCRVMFFVIDMDLNSFWRPQMITKFHTRRVECYVRMWKFTSRWLLSFVVAELELCLSLIWNWIVSWSFVVAEVAYCDHVVPMEYLVESYAWLRTSKPLTSNSTLLFFGSVATPVQITRSVTNSASATTNDHKTIIDFHFRGTRWNLVVFSRIHGMCCDFHAWLLNLKPMASNSTPLVGISQQFPVHAQMTSQYSTSATTKWPQNNLIPHQGDGVLRQDVWFQIEI